MYGSRRVMSVMMKQLEVAKNAMRNTLVKTTKDMDRVIKRLAPRFIIPRVTDFLVASSAKFVYVIDEDKLEMYECEVLTHDFTEAFILINDIFIDTITKKEIKKITKNKFLIRLE